MVEEGALTQIKKDILGHYRWVIHYCADFSNIGHGKHQCIAIFQVLLPTITLELGDVATQEWTILRELGG